MVDMFFPHSLYPLYGFPTGEQGKQNQTKHAMVMNCSRKLLGLTWRMVNLLLMEITLSFLKQKNEARRSLTH